MSLTVPCVESLKFPSSPLGNLSLCSPSVLLSLPSFSCLSSLSGCSAPRTCLAEVSSFFQPSLLGRVLRLVSPLLGMLLSTEKEGRKSVVGGVSVHTLEVGASRVGFFSFLLLFLAWKSDDEK